MAGGDAPARMLAVPPGQPHRKRPNAAGLPALLSSRTTEGSHAGLRNTVATEESP
jgi:hypothetical protein